MRILCTNDDGIHAPGLKIVEKIAGILAGEKDEVNPMALLEFGLRGAVLPARPLDVAGAAAVGLPIVRAAKGR